MEPEFTCVAAAFFFAFLGAYAPYFYIETFCLEIGIASAQLIPYLLPIINAGGFLGRIVRYLRAALFNITQTR